MNNERNYVIGCRTMTNTSSVIGNITATVGSWLIDKFPKGYIRKLHVSEAFVPLTSMSNDKETLIKTDIQTLYIQPTWDPTNISYDLPRWHKSNEFVLGSRRNNYNIVLEDWENRTFIYSIPNRIKVNFQCRIKLNTYMQAVDVANMLYQIFDVGGYRYLNNIRLQTELPIMLIHPICMKQGIDYKTDEGKDKIAEYLLENSYNGIREKRNLGNGNRMYAYSYTGNILLSFPDVPEISKDLDNLSVGNAYVDFAFGAEFWTPANFLFEADKLTEKEIQPIGEIEGIDQRTSIFTVYIPTEYIKAFKDGKHLLYKEEFYPDINVEYDELDFSSILEPNLIAVIQTLRKQGYRLDNVLEIMVSANAKILMPEEFDVDWDRLVLKTKKPMVNTTYMFILYGDISKLNEVEQEIHPDKPYGFKQYGLHDIEI